ncbi:MAG TPA: mechanosensitive ion channel family protein [Methylomirabilota bacterium]|nr:mechanosensitive ion channel family protein [Methylomirabilota bacterium]
MKLKFPTLFRAYLLIVVSALAWCLLSSAQTTNSTAGAPSATTTLRAGDTNSVVSLTQTLTEEQRTVLTFGLNKIPALQHTALGIPFWQYIASFMYIFLAYAVSKAVDWLVRVQLRKWAARTETKFDELLLDLVDGPIVIVSFVIFLHLGLHMFTWPRFIEDFLSKGLRVIVAISITYMLVKVVDLMVDVWKTRVTKAGDPKDKTYNEQLFPIISKSIKTFIIVVSVLVTSDNLGLNITGLIASLSITGLALGLAAQDTVANLFGAVAVFIDKPFQIGDRIKLADVDGTVETIGLRSTRVRSLDGHLITVPNKTMGNATVTNITRRPTIKTEMNIGITYETSPAKIREAVAILKEVYGKHPMTHDLSVSFNKFLDSSLNISVVHWWKNLDNKAYTAGIEEMNLQVKERFDAAGIEFAYPTRTVWMKQAA